MERPRGIPGRDCLIWVRASCPHPFVGAFWQRAVRFQQGYDAIVQGQLTWSAISSFL